MTREEIYLNNVTRGDFPIYGPERYLSKVIAITNTGHMLSFQPSEAYFSHHLTLNELDTKEACDKVIASMDKLNIIACVDAQAVVERWKDAAECIFTKDDIYSIRDSLQL